MTLVYKVVRKSNTGEWGSVSVPESNPFFMRYYLGQKIESGWRGSWLFTFTELKQAVEFLHEWLWGLTEEDFVLEILECEAEVMGPIEFFTNPGDPDEMMFYWERILSGNWSPFEDVLPNIYPSAVFSAHLTPLKLVDWKARYRVTKHHYRILLEEI
jgi:hypothetical protein